jgi:putative tryptophan/tyrosine transport system substrate-binding protein
MRRVGVISAVVFCATLAAGSPASAGQVAIVLSSQAGPYMQTEGELKVRLVKLGHTTRTTTVEELAKGPAPAARAGEAFVAVGTRAACWLRANLPPAAALAYCMVSDPQANGLEEGRITPGVSTDVPLAAQFRLICEALPQAATAGLLYRSDSDKSTRMLAAARAALPKGWKLQAVAVDKHDSVAKAIEDLLGKGVDVVWTAPDSAVCDAATVGSLFLAAIRNNTPVFGFSPAFVRAGALIGVGIDPAAQGKQAAAAAGRRAHHSPGGQAAEPGPRVPDRRQPHRRGETLYCPAEGPGRSSGPSLRGGR